MTRGSLGQEGGGPDQGQRGKERRERGLGPGAEGLVAEGPEAEGRVAVGPEALGPEAEGLGAEVLGAVGPEADEPADWGAHEGRGSQGSGNHAADEPGGPPRCNRRREG